MVKSKFDKKGDGIFTPFQNMYKDFSKLGNSAKKLFQLLFMVLLIIHQKLEKLSQIMDLELLKK